MSEPAADVYEIVIEETSQPNKFMRTLVTLVSNVFKMVAMEPATANPGGMIISVRHQQTGEELFRHVEDMGDDEGHLLHGIEQDLATMSAADFRARWAS